MWVRKDGGRLAGGLASIIAFPPVKRPSRPCANISAIYKKVIVFGCMRLQKRNLRKTLVTRVAQMDPNANSAPRFPHRPEDPCP